MKPIIVVPPKSISPEDLEALRNNGLCVVVANDPSKIQFIDPVWPTQTSRTDIERAAIELSRRLLVGQFPQYPGRAEINKIFCDILLTGTRLDQSYQEWKGIEFARLIKADAKAERDAAKKAELAKAVTGEEKK